jgi:hypothetical protein
MQQEEDIRRKFIHQTKYRKTEEQSLCNNKYLTKYNGKDKTKFII